MLFTFNGSQKINLNFFSATGIAVGLWPRLLISTFKIQTIEMVNISFSRKNICSLLMILNDGLRSKITSNPADRIKFNSSSVSNRNFSDKKLALQKSLCCKKSEMNLNLVKHQSIIRYNRLISRI